MKLAAVLFVVFVVAVSVQAQQRTLVQITTCAAGQVASGIGATGGVTCEVPSGGGVPSGMLTFILSGTCASGWTEETSLNGKTLLGTLAANLDVGAAGGNDNITPAGTVSQPTFTGDVFATHQHSDGTFAAAAQVFTGAASACVVNHVHVQSVNSAAAGGLSGYTADTSTNTSVSSGYSTANPTGGSASCTPAGTSNASDVTGNTGAITAGTPSGIVSQPTFAGTPAENRSAFVKVIFCKKN